MKDRPNIVIRDDTIMVKANGIMIVIDCKNSHVEVTGGKSVSWDDIPLSSDDDSSISGDEERSPCSILPAPERKQ